MKICIFYTEGNLCGQIGLPWAMAVILGIYFSSQEFDGDMGFLILKLGTFSFLKVLALILPETVRYDRCDLRRLYI